MPAFDGEFRMSSSTERELLKPLVARIAQPNWDNNLKLDVWDRGGPPGRGYESNLLEFWHSRKSLCVKYTKARFDPARPPYKVDRFLLVQKDVQTKWFSGLVDAGLFVRSFAEEIDPGIGDVTKITFTLMLDGKEQASQTFFQSLPPTFNALKSQLVEWMKECEDSEPLPSP
jgi:hypothetical protein